MVCLMALTPINRCSETIETNYQLKLICPLHILAVKKKKKIFKFFCLLKYEQQQQQQQKQQKAKRTVLALLT